MQEMGKDQELKEKDGGREEKQLKGKKKKALRKTQLA